ncbi:MAG: terpene cyclase/mutase family protein, partial [Clostridia bacterium]|nr:terpene cyclase/mutase family protein [Clostridia bacterium]
MIRKLIHTKFMTKLILVLFCVSIFLPGLPLLLTSLIESAAYAGESGYTVSDAVYKTVNYYLTHKNILTSWQEVWSLNKAGVDLSDDEKWSLPEWNIENNDALEYANKIIGIYCSGEDPSDLVTQLLSKQIDNGSFGESLNYTYWSIIALNMVNAGDDNSDAVSKAINYLISQQNDDGGFPITVKGDPSGADTTGMALLALSPYRVQDGVSECVERAINYLQNIQMDNGAFSYDGTATAESTAFAIIGLVASGEDITDNKWKKDNRTIIDALMDFQLGDGSFSHYKGGSSNSMATSQALLALSYLVGDYADYVIIGDENASEDPEIKPEIRVRIEGQNETLFDEVIEVTDETTGIELLRTAIG